MCYCSVDQRQKDRHGYDCVPFFRAVIEQIVFCRLAPQALTLVLPE